VEIRKFSFWLNYLKFVSIFFACLGVMWALIGSFDSFGIYDKMWAETFWAKEQLPADVARAKTFLLAPFGATSAGYFILQYFIAKYAYAKRELWAFKAIIFAFFFWFILDTILFALHGAYFNILLANIPSLVAMLPVVFTKKYFKPSGSHA